MEILFPRFPGRTYNGFSSSDNKASFCFYDQGYYTEGKPGLKISSAIIFGHVRMIENKEERISAVRRIALKYELAEYVEKETRQTENIVQAFIMIIDHMTGKLVNESRSAYGRTEPADEPMLPETIHAKDPAAVQLVCMPRHEQICNLWHRGNDNDMISSGGEHDISLCRQI